MSNETSNTLPEGTYRLTADFPAISVLDALFMACSDMAWHATSTTEEAFVELARRGFQTIAKAHARCARGADVAEPRGRAVRDDVH